MMNIYYTSEHGNLIEINEIKNGCWIKLVSPTEEEIQNVVQRLEIPLDFIKDALDEEERSRIEKHRNQLLMIIDIPLKSFNHSKQKPFYETIPMGIIVTEKCFITVCLKENSVFDDFIQNKVKEFYTYKKTRFCLQMLYKISTYYLLYLKQINKKTDSVEAELHQSMKNKELYTLLDLQKSLVYFTTSLKSNNLVMQKLLNGNFLKMYEDDQELLEDVIIENKQAIEMAETYTSILSGMMDAFASVISNNLNIVMKFLTSITIILSLPTMVASFFGMNVSIPFQHYPHAFTIAIMISAFLSCFTAIIFWKKRFF